MDLMTVLGGALLLWVAYKAGMYLERKMQAKAKMLQEQADAKPDSEPKA